MRNPKKILPVVVSASFLASILFADVIHAESTNVTKNVYAQDASPTMTLENSKEAVANDTYEEVLSQYSDRIRESTPEEIQKAKEVGSIDIKSPEELADLLKESEKLEHTLKAQSDVVEWNNQSFQPLTVAPSIGTMAANRYSYAKSYELAHWGNPIINNQGSLIGRTTIYYWTDSNKIDQTTTSSFMQGTVSGREWAPLPAEVSTTSVFSRTVRYVGTLKQFTTINGAKTYTTFTTISQATTIASPNAYGPFPE